MKYSILILYVFFSPLYSSNQDLRNEFIVLRNYLYRIDRVIQHEHPIHLSLMDEYRLLGSYSIPDRYERTRREQARFSRIVLLRMTQNQRYTELLQALINSNQITYYEIFRFNRIEQIRERSSDSETELISNPGPEEYISTSRLLSSSSDRSSSSDSINSYDTIPYDGENQN